LRSGECMRVKHCRGVVITAKRVKIFDCGIG
jgi:hypothetical protein